MILCIYPKNVKVDLPLQAYFRINAENAGQFERTLIVARKGLTCIMSKDEAPAYRVPVTLF